jgi:hypothetical protein
MADNDAPLRESADARAVLCDWAGTWAPSGRHLGPALDSVERLGRMLTWAADHGRLSTVATPAQVWIVGGAVDSLGWGVDPGAVAGESAAELDAVRAECRDRLTEAVARTVPALERAGWRPRDGWETGGAWVRLERIPPRERRRDKAGPPPMTARVDVILEAYAWTTPAPSGDENLGILGDEAAGWGLPAPAADADDEAIRAAETDARAELGRRLCRCVQWLTVLPAITPSRTGALITGRLWREGAEHNRKIAANDHRAHPAHVLAAPVAVPALSAPPRGELEPPTAWAVPVVDPDALAAADRLVITDRFGAYGASMSVGFPVGEPEYLDAAACARELWHTDTPPAHWPVGLWTCVFPGPETLPDWDVLPPAHPEWWRQATAAAAAGQIPDGLVTVTTETLAGLAQTWTSGPGIDWCRTHLAIVDGWRWPASSRALERLQPIIGDTLRAADAAGDRAMGRFGRAVMRAYVGALGNSPDQWGKFRAAHSTPIGQAQIHAHARWSLRRKLDGVRVRTGSAPLMARTDAGTFLVSRGMDLGLFGDGDPGTDKHGTPKPMPLGHLRLERWCEITDAARDQLAAARGPDRVAAAIGAAFAGADRVEVCK